MLCSICSRMVFAIDFFIAWTSYISPNIMPQYDQYHSVVSLIFPSTPAFTLYKCCRIKVVFATHYGQGCLQWGYLSSNTLPVKSDWSLHHPKICSVFFPLRGGTFVWTTNMEWAFVFGFFCLPCTWNKFGVFLL